MLVKEVILNDISKVKKISRRFAFKAKRTRYHSPRNFQKPNVIQYMMNMNDIAKPRKSLGFGAGRTRCRILDIFKGPGKPLCLLMPGSASLRRHGHPSFVCRSQLGAARSAIAALISKSLSRRIARLA
jgi:hypothetical protein